MGALDRILISSREGLSVVWYSERSWHHATLGPGNDFKGLVLPGQLSFIKVGRDCTAYIVVSEVRAVDTSLNTNVEPGIGK